MYPESEMRGAGASSAVVYRIELKSEVLAIATLVAAGRGDVEIKLSEKPCQ
jgi:hypothetical protein